MGKATFFCFLLGSLNSESSEPSSTGHREVNWSPREPRSLPRFSYLKETATLRLAPIWWVPKKIFMGIYWGIGESRPCKGGCIGLNGTANAYISVDWVLSSSILKWDSEGILLVGSLCWLKEMKQARPESMQGFTRDIHNSLCVCSHMSTHTHVNV